MSAIPENFGSGGAGLTPNDSAGQPELATILREIADDLAALNPDGSDWSDELTVTTNVVTLASAGLVAAVDGTTGGSAGPKAMVYGTPGAGQVKVEYTDGVATLTFAGADGITGARVILLPAATLSTTKA